MIRSMTAFASAESATPFGALAFELRSVNHRYLEVSPRLPEELRALEPLLRERIAAKITRGKIDVNLRFRPLQAGATELKVDRDLLARLGVIARETALDIPHLQVGFTELLNWPGVLIQQDIDSDGLKQATLDLLDQAIADMVATRQREGDRLAEFINERLSGVERIVADVRTWLPDIRAAARTRLDTRIAEIKQPLDPGRLEQELVMQLQKLDVDEELDRLGSHIAEARRILTLKEPSGRRLDFMMQEFNREANTLGSKSVDQRTTQSAVELKVLIEQIREQVQNIE
jgi:uncharacterized protein (TIGR00255 family)